MEPKPDKPLISVVVPCFNEEQSIPYFISEMSAVALDMPGFEFELLFIDDGSSDATLSVLRKFSAEDSRVKYVSFSRNFGKEAAMLAGFEAAKGDFIAVMDADLQDPPKLLKEMMNAIAEDGFDCAAARRVTRRGESPVRSFFAKNFYKIINKVSKTEIVDGARDFRLMTRQVMNAILQLREYNRFSKGIFGWVGFKTKWIEYENMPRVAGSTKWSFWGLFSYAVDGIVGFSTAPLALSSLFGALFFIISLIGIVFIVVRAVLFGDPVSGWPSMVCIILLSGGIQLFCISVLGEYLTKTYLESKQRPIYIAKESNVSIRKGDYRTDGKI